jgi:zinc protease
MRDLNMTEDDVATERKVILEERNQRTDNDPGALFMEQRRAAQYLNSPYGIPVIGWRQEMEGLSRDDAFGFYHRFYAPNNAILVVAGDVDPAEVKALAEQYYGPVDPSDGIVPRVRPQEPPQLAERRMTFSDPRVSQPYVARTYLAPERDSGAQENAAALTYLAEILGGSGATSVLGQKLQFDTQTAVYTGAYYDGTSLDDDTFTVMLAPSDGITLEEGEAAMDKVLADFLEEGIDDSQFERIKFQIRAAQIYAEDDIAGLARRYGEALAVGLTVEDVQAWPDILDAVTKDDVMKAAHEVLDRRRSVTGWLTAEAVQ